MMTILVPMKAVASYWLECNGLVTIKSDITYFSEVDEPHINADFLIHDDTFTCKGHGSKLDFQDVIKNANISIGKLTNETQLEKGNTLLVKYTHVNSKTPSGATLNISWEASKKVDSVTANTVEVENTNTNPIPESSSDGIDLNAEEALWQEWQTSEEEKKTDLDSSNSGEKFSIFRGMFFRIFYPQNFSAQPYLIDESMDPMRLPRFPDLDYIETDGAYFTSPDGLVEFFIYAAKNTMNPENYIKTRQNEVLISRKSEKYSFEERHHNYQQKSWVTTKEKGNAYYRSFIHQRDCHYSATTSWSDCETKVLGVKYSNADVYYEYRDLFKEFRDSLVVTSCNYAVMACDL